MKTMNTDFDQSARDSFAAAASMVSPNTHYRLEQAVQAAIRAPAQLQETRSQPRQWKWFGLGLGGGAVFASLLVVALWNPLSTTTQTPAIAESSAVSTDPTDWSADLDDDPSMYAWIASAEGAAVVR